MRADVNAKLSVEEERLASLLDTDRKNKHATEKEEMYKQIHGLAKLFSFPPGQNFGLRAVTLFFWIVVARLPVCFL